uniref:Uncharacterized protein n=1 Tax=Talaromyces marneffei PM1 TaxID=1077442 RepID=A0A093V1C4_TALMA
MEAKHSYSSTPLTEDRKQQDSFQQESNLSRYSSSQSSQIYTSVPSGTGASGQSATSFTENMELHHYQVVFAYQQALSADQQDFIHAGSWDTIEPHSDTFIIENDSILSPTYRNGAAVEPASRANGEDTEGGEAVGLFRASQHRKV